VSGQWIDVDVTIEMYVRPCTRSDATGRSKWSVQMREDALDAPIVSELCMPQDTLPAYITFSVNILTLPSSAKVSLIQSGQHRQWRGIKERPWVAVSAIEPVLNLSHGIHSTIDIRVAWEHEECGIDEVTEWWSCGDIGAYINLLSIFGKYCG
jgi:hypothetical protein